MGEHTNHVYVKTRTFMLLINLVDVFLHIDPTPFLAFLRERLDDSHNENGYTSILVEDRDFSIDFVEKIRDVAEHPYIDLLRAELTEATDTVDAGVYLHE